MKMEFSEEVCKEICLNLKLARVFKSYRKILKKYYEENQMNEYENFNSFVIHQSGFKIK